MFIEPVPKVTQAPAERHVRRTECGQLQSKPEDLQLAEAHCTRITQVLGQMKREPGPKLADPRHKLPPAKKTLKACFQDYRTDPFTASRFVRPRRAHATHILKNETPANTQLRRTRTARETRLATADTAKSVPPWPRQDSALAAVGVIASPPTSDWRKSDCRVPLSRNAVTDDSQECRVA